MKKLMCLWGIAAILLSGCSSNNKSNQDIIAVINDNLHAAQQEDLKAYMATIHPKTPVYAQTELGMKYVFNTLDLSYEIEDIKVIEMNKTIAKATWTQYTKKIKGPDFPDSKSLVMTTFMKYNDEWKLYTSEILSTSKLTD